MIRKISIENFRSIKKQELILQKLTAIIGKNGSGKSNFISAITLFKNLAIGGDIDTVVNTKIAPLTNELFFFKDHQTNTRFEFLITTKNGNNYSFSYHIAFTKIAGAQRLVVQDEFLKKIGGGGIEQTIYRREREMAYAGEKQAQIPFKVEPSRLMLSSYSDESVSEVVKTVSAYTIIDSNFEVKEGLNVVQGNRPNLNTIDGVAVSLFKKNHGRFDNAVKSIQRIISGFIAPSIISLNDEDPTKNDLQNQEDDTKTYLVTWKDTSFPNRFSQMSLSSGDKRVIHLLFSLFNTEENSFLVTEEIENGMHYERVSKLLDEIRTQASNRKIQLLFTTHSDEILKRLTVSEVVYFKKDPEQGTVMKPISDTNEYTTIRDGLQGGHTVADVLQSGLF